ncbi:high affinity copper transporter [Arthroderma uncinatum]|uniref:high affinity copper transporter n=1 Tax=Arthroderma uncinatum TaxID=74035 RepID=UPI00144AB773|nr:high affinity copper transporter [Arthroderma uncinatum]KAF3490785.1 high affinity copper transporter [Arthroderma uncinatum]
MAMITHAPMPASTGTMHHDMDMNKDMGGGCKISMLWNWNVMDTCFISSTWQITSKGMFAGSCIGVILLVMSLEFLRRLGHEFDNHIAGRPSLISTFVSHPAPVGSRDAESEDTEDPLPKPVTPASAPSGCVHGQGQRRYSPTLLQHTVRSLLHMMQFGVAYFVMLLAMYYNGYFIICILIGAFLGSFAFSWKSQERR